MKFDIWHDAGIWTVKTMIIIKLNRSFFCQYCCCFCCCCVNARSHSQSVSSALQRHRKSRINKEGERRCEKWGTSIVSFWWLSPVFRCNIYNGAMTSQQQPPIMPNIGLVCAEVFEIYEYHASALVRKSIAMMRKRPYTRKYRTLSKLVRRCELLDSLATKGQSSACIPSHRLCLLLNLNQAKTDKSFYLVPYLFRRPLTFRRRFRHLVVSM